MEERLFGCPHGGGPLLTRWYVEQSPGGGRLVAVGGDGPGGAVGGEVLAGAGEQEPRVGDLGGGGAKEARGEGEVLLVTLTVAVGGVPSGAGGAGRW